MTTIGIVWFWLVMTAAVVLIGATLLRTSCCLANSFNRATTRGAPIPLVSYKDAAGIIFVTGFLAALLTRAMDELLPLFYALGWSQEVFQVVAAVLPPLFFVLFVATHLPSDGRTGTAIRVLAAAVLLGLVFGVFMVGKGAVAFAA